MIDRAPIRSRANPHVKRVREVLRGRAPDLLVVEGDRLVDDALASGLAPEFVLVAEEREERAVALEARGVAVRRAASSLLDSLSRLTTSPGVLALFHRPEPRGPSGWPAAADALVVVAAGLGDPGNVGALARTAEAAGVAALVLTGGGCGPWNEKALRGSMGSLLRLAVHEVPGVGEAWDALATAGFRHVLAATRGGSAPARTDWSGRLALWVLPESGAAPPELEARRGAAEVVTIPMAPGVESLNATVAAAVLLFAAGRVGGER